MVRVENVFGDITTGKSGEAVYQRKYGRGMRRLYREVKPSQTPPQLEQQQRFKDAIAWVKSLSYLEKQAIKEYCRTNRIGYKQGEPIHWYNWAKNLGMTRPKFQIVNSETGEYKVKHPAIYKIEEVDVVGNLLFSIDDLSDVLDYRYLQVYQQVPTSASSCVRVTTLSGNVYEFGSVVESVSMIYCSELYCNPNYCK